MRFKSPKPEFAKTLHQADPRSRVLCGIQFNPKDQYLVAGGAYNGVVQYWGRAHP